MTALRLLTLALIVPIVAIAQPPSGQKDRGDGKPKTKTTPKKPAPPTINELIVTGCKLNVEKKVGDGESASLAVFALKQCGARPKGADYPEKGDSTWGMLVYRFDGKDKSEMGKLDDVLPGDICQFGEAKFKGFTVHQHTAIVRNIVNDKGIVQVWEQRGKENKDVVLEGEYTLGEMSAGWLRIYRPVAR